MEHQTSIAIRASAGTVWRVLTAVEDEPEWTASMTSVQRLDSGRKFGVGSAARIKQPRLPKAVWRVTALDEGRSYTWESRSAGIRTIADHDIAEGPGSHVIVRLAIRFSGPLSGPVRLLLGGLTQRYLQTEAAGLKARCEQEEAGEEGPRG